jgi:hypothetical protein
MIERLCVLFVGDGFLNVFLNYRLIPCRIGKDCECKKWIFLKITQQMERYLGELSARVALMFYLNMRDTSRQR